MLVFMLVKMITQSYGQIVLLLSPLGGVLDYLLKYYDCAIVCREPIICAIVASY